jgi:malate/lactate dehydrogenase
MLNPMKTVDMSMMHLNTLERNKNRCIKKEVKMFKPSTVVVVAAGVTAKESR